MADHRITSSNSVKGTPDLTLVQNKENTVYIPLFINVYNMPPRFIQLPPSPIIIEFDPLIQSSMMQIYYLPLVIGIGEKTSDKVK